MQAEFEGSDYEDEILLVELAGVPNPDAVLQSKGPCSILGLDTAEPVLQLENYVFRGRYQESLGTSLLFRENAGKLKYVCQATKKLSMSRVVLRKKTTNGSNAAGEDESKSMDTGTGETQSPST